MKMGEEEIEEVKEIKYLDYVLQKKWNGICTQKL